MAVDFDRDSFPDMRLDAHFLPFKNRSYDVVYSSHTLEHVLNPYQVLKEFARVAPVLVLSVPNAVYNRAGILEDKTHLFSWNRVTLSNLLGLVYDRVVVSDNWSVKGLDRFGFVAREIKIVKTLLCVLVMGENSELTALAFNKNKNQGEKNDKC